jgi:uncharacterized repeat protein (TIGR03803 family)
VNPDSFLKTFLKQMMLTLAVLLLGAASGLAQILSPVYDLNTSYGAMTTGLLLSSNELYGTIVGNSQSSVVFKLNTNGAGFTNLYTFSPVVFYSPGVYTNTDGADSYGQLVLSGNTLYGTTEAGGFNGEGTVFAVNTDGTGFTNLHNFSATVYTGFTSNSDGAIPSAGLVLSGNTLYGTTSTGGSFGGGTVFAVNTDGTGFTNLYNFSLDYDPPGGLSNRGLKSRLVFSNNILYGTTIVGGSSSNGTVFALNTDGTGFTNLHSFSPLVQDTNSDGAAPKAGLILSGDTLYGTATVGGSIYTGTGRNALGGTVFAVNTDGTDFKNLHSFRGSDGGDPVAGLVLSSNVLYGTTQEGGGSVGAGTVFAINTDGTGFATLHTFTRGTSNPSGNYTNANGYVPVGDIGLSGSTLYGATQDGGTNGYGTVFALNLAVAPPAMQFTATPTNGIVRLTVQFNGPAVDADGNPILAWNWNFGDGPNSTNTAQNPSHTYTNAATFLPMLICVNNNGDPVIGSGPAIMASVPPPIHFTANPTNGLPPLAVQFNSPGADAGSNTIVSWNWNFGDGSSDTAQNPSHTYTNGGTFFPSLTCTNNNGNMLAGSGPAIAVINSLLLNGGFETGTFTNWTQSGYTNGNFVSANYAHSGKYGAELYVPSGGAMGFLSQTFPTVSGVSYVISFWLDSPFGVTPNDFQVSWNGNVLLDETNLAGVGWTNFQLTVTAMGTSSTLQLGYLTGLFFGLDDVSVSSITGGGSAPFSIAHVTASGTNLVINGSNGQSGQTYYLLMGTNLTEPFAQWIPVASNTPSSDGNFSITATNAVSPNAPKRFFILRTP